MPPNRRKSTIQAENKPIQPKRGAPPGGGGGAEPTPDKPKTSRPHGMGRESGAGAPGTGEAREAATARHTTPRTTPGRAREWGGRINTGQADTAGARNISRCVIMHARGGAGCAVALHSAERSGAQQRAAAPGTRPTFVNIDNSPGAWGGRTLRDPRRRIAKPRPPPDAPLLTNDTPTRPQRHSNDTPLHTAGTAGNTPPGASGA